MNLRISNSQLRFRITQSELGQLQAGERLTLSLDMESLSPMYTIIADDAASPLILDILGPNIWRLRVERNALDALAQTLPSREGIECEFQSLRLALEVDVRRAS